jgi:hypothetical protein
MGHVEFVRRAPEAQVPGRRFKGAELVQRRQASGHEAGGLEILTTPLRYDRLSAGIPLSYTLDAEQWNSKTAHMMALGDHRCMKVKES